MLDIAARTPDIMVAVLKDSNCPYPISFSTTVNARGAVTLTTNNIHNLATAYSPYYQAMTLRLNQSFPLGENPFLTFHPAPNEVQLAIHGLPTVFLPSDPALLRESLSTSINNDAEVTIFSARFLQPDPDKSVATTSVVVTVSPYTVAKLGSSNRLFLQPRRVELANAVTRFFQCCRCWKYEHLTNVCKTEHPMCLLCANSHTRSAHRYSNPTCLKNGNVKAVPACRPTSPLHCPNCHGPHTAMEPTCPSCPCPSSPRNPPPPPSDDGTDESGGEGPAPP